jgi:hypothetical protein
MSVTDTPRHANRVPAEWLGKARLFRDAVCRADLITQDEARRIIAPLQARLARKPGLRLHQAIDAARVWREMPSPYRIALNIDLDDAGGLVIDDWQLNGCHSFNREWDDPSWEPGVTLLRVGLRTRAGVVLEAVPICIISLHATARWFQRSWPNDEPALIRDIGQLLTTQKCEGRVACAGGGDWLGHTTVAHGGRKAFRCFDVRTFVV